MDASEQVEQADEGRFERMVGRPVPERASECGLTECASKPMCVRCTRMADMDALCGLLPEGVHWGDPLTPEVLRELLAGGMTGERTVAALYVEPKGCYVGVPGVDPWDEARDARTYAGPHPVVAHPPCQRWGRFWHGSTRKPHQYALGDDGGCFAAALAAVKRWGGVLEHPAHSKAWDAFGIRKPLPCAGWWWCPDHGVWVCHVEQGHYGHDSRKPTWLIAARIHRNDLPELNWAKGEQRLPAWMIERYGYEKARRIGVVAMVGGKNKTAIRNATPEPFRDLLLSIARKAHNAKGEAWP